MPSRFLFDLGHDPLPGPRFAVRAIVAERIKEVGLQDLMAGGWRDVKALQTAYEAGRCGDGAPRGRTGREPAGNGSARGARSRTPGIGEPSNWHRFGTPRLKSRLFACPSEFASILFRLSPGSRTGSGTDIAAL
jgi:hypothetical protein